MYSLISLLRLELDLKQRGWRQTIFIRAASVESWDICTGGPRSSQCSSQNLQPFWPVFKPGTSSCSGPYGWWLLQERRGIKKSLISNARLYPGALVQLIRSQRRPCWWRLPPIIRIPVIVPIQKSGSEFFTRSSEADISEKWLTGGWISRRLIACSLGERAGPGFLKGKRW